MPPNYTRYASFRLLKAKPEKLPFPKQAGPYFLPFIVGADKEIPCDHKHQIQDFSLGIIEPQETCMISLAPGVVLTNLNREIPLEAGNLILVRQPANVTLTTQRHSGSWSSVYLNFRDEYPCTALSWLRQRLGTVTDLSGLPGFAAFLRSTFELLQKMQQEPLPPKEELSLKTYNWFLQLAGLCQPLLEQDTSASFEEIVPGQLLSSNCRTLKEFAHQTQYSPSYLSKKLSELWNNPPGKVLKEARLQMARDLVQETDLEIHHIANRIGYDSSSSFIRAFRQRFGLSPGKLRHQAALQKTGPSN
jgi:AraC-like DNA-binding protein